MEAKQGWSWHACSSAGYCGGGTEQGLWVHAGGGRGLRFSDGSMFALECASEALTLLEHAPDGSSQRALFSRKKVVRAETSKEVSRLPAVMEDAGYAALHVRGLPSSRRCASGARLRVGRCASGAGSSSTWTAPSARSPRSA
mgnify:CR=1 FL=1